MKKAVFIKSFSKYYTNIYKKFKYNRKLLDAVKLLVTILIFVLTVGVYGYFINISSTEGYFLRQEMEELRKEKFKYNIVQLDVLEKKKELKKKINKQNSIEKTEFSRKSNGLNIDTRYITIQKDQGNISYK